jgi:aminopeptidase
MTDPKLYFAAENEKVRKDYEKSLAAVAQVGEKTEDFQNAGEKKEYYKLINRIAGKILKFAELEKQLDTQYFASTSLDNLAAQNRSFFEEILPENYSESYANPAYAVQVFGDKFGQLISQFYLIFRQYVTYTFTHKLFRMEPGNRLLVDVFNYIETNPVDYDALKDIMTRIPRQETAEDLALDIKQRVDSDFGFFTDVVVNSDLKDLRYLYKYGSYVSDNELRIARFLADYSEEKIVKLSARMVDAYLKGFKRDNKDISKKSTVQVMYNLGQERILRQVIDELSKKGLKAIVSRAATTQANRQYGYDHRFDNALYLDEEFVKSSTEKYQKAYDMCADMLTKLSGVMFIDKFGDAPFKPEAKPQALTLGPDQQRLFMTYQSAIMQIDSQYMPRSETSFSIISFPVPDIGDHFEQVFEDILEVNMGDGERFLNLQQTIIQALDKADHVHVKGGAGNETDIKVNLLDLKDPAKQTNFMNSGADVNIPAGEVFTSPKLTGTNGVLHVAETYLRGLRYVDLKLTFKDGYITDYSCANFDDQEENKRYVKQNLLHPHDSLPLGEFAIGTNTLAYVVARKHNILNVLPILIIEKMGPHFAVGDTCFSRSEDKPTFNPDGREVIARENEHSACRKEDPQKAYTNVHTDITLPYESIGHISAITPSGDSIDIIRDGQFVLAGLEELNQPLKEIM